MAGKGVNRGRCNSISIIDDAPAISPYLHWLHKLVGLYSSVFRYKNMPSTVDMIQAEKWLVEYGMVCFYYVKSVGLVCLPCADAFNPNVYGYPTNIAVFSLNGYNDTVSIDNAAICYDNVSHEAPRYELAYYAKRLAEYDTTIDVNTMHQRTPYIYEITEDQELSVKNVDRQIQAGFRTIYLKKPKNQQDRTITIENTVAPYVADKIQQQKDALLREISNFMGIFSGESLKAERVTSGENAANVGFIRAARNSRFNQREMFCSKINEKFGDLLEEPVSVEYSEDAIERIAAGLVQVGRCEFTNGEIHDRTITDY